MSPTPGVLEDLSSARERGLRVLVADDDPIMRQLAVAQLSTPGFETATAGDGAAAWTALDGDAAGFDAVLSDLEMPGLDGFELLSRIRGDRRFAHLPVVVITSRNDMEAIDRAYALGATSFVSKPVNWGLLGHQLRYVVRSSRIEAEVRQARDEARRAAALRDSLIALLQHETRTPLHGIIGFAEVLRAESAASPAAQGHADAVCAAARRLGDTLRQVFTFAQVSTGSVDLDRESVPFGAIVEDVIGPARARAAEAGVAIELCQDGPAADRIEGDVRHLAGAVRSILDHAVARAPRGGTVRAVLGSGDGFASLAVEDGGPDLDGDALRRCREPFAPGGSHLTCPDGSLGLGLPTAGCIAELHGGRLELTATPGRGATACLRLPISASARRAA